MTDRPNRSPFYVIPEFISPLMCEDIIDMLNFTVPDTDKDGHPVMSHKSCDIPEEMLFSRASLIVPELMAYYRTAYKGIERMQFEWYPEGSSGKFVCENSEYVRKKWLRTRSRDFSGILFLSDYQDQPTFDNDYEVYGGKLEFVQHKFSFNPNRGTLVIYPSDPHFINATSTTHVGDAYQVRLHFATKTPFIYNPQEFPGNYTTWFKNQF